MIPLRYGTVSCRDWDRDLSSTCSWNSLLSRWTPDSSDTVRSAAEIGIATSASSTCLWKSLLSRWDTQLSRLSATPAQLMPVRVTPQRPNFSFGCEPHVPWKSKALGRRLNRSNLFHILIQLPLLYFIYTSFQTKLTAIYLYMNPTHYLLIKMEGWKPICKVFIIQHNRIIKKNSTNLA